MSDLEGAIMFVSILGNCNLSSLFSHRSKRLFIRGMTGTLGVLIGSNSSYGGVRSLSFCKGSDHFSPLTSILRNYNPIKSFGPDLVFAYNSRQKTPDWVYERIFPENLKGKVNRKSCNFLEDGDLHVTQRSRLSDYEGSGYSRGHMATCSNYRSDKRKMKKTFILSMICPQISKKFNSGIWAKVENFIQEKIRRLNANECAHIITGPLYLVQKDDQRSVVAYEVVGDGQVSVATHFFKVVFFEKNNNWESLSFVVPHQAIPSSKKAEDFFSTVEAVERLSGIVFSQYFEDEDPNLLVRERQMPLIKDLEEDE